MRKLFTSEALGSAYSVVMGSAGSVLKERLEFAPLFVGENQVAKAQERLSEAVLKLFRMPRQRS